MSCVQNHPYLSKKTPYQWISVTDYWPQRLLHIPTMNSVERDESNVYSGVSGVQKAEKPKYSILTYTWGRWKIRNVKTFPALRVLNIPWDIPAIEEEHFTVEEFQKVVNVLGKDGIDWAWIDVACIDQEDQDANAEEVGRQASIFKNAHRVLVWLSHLRNDVLTSAVATIQKSGLELRDYVDRPSTSLPNKDIISSLHQELSVVFADPWFSSLWTLQEVILRNDAIALSKEAEAIVWDIGQYTYLTMFINLCQNVFQDLKRIDKKIEESTRQYLSLEPQRQEIEKKVCETKQLILQAGFHFLHCSNPNVQYGIARYRRTSRDVDRVYAIMQIYDLRVGKSIRSKERPPLAELGDEFAAALNQKSPIMGQMFVHAQAPQQFKSWRITEESTVPDRLMIYKEPRLRSELTMISRTMTARGPCCPFFDLLSTIKNALKDPFDNAFELFLDAHVFDSLADQRRIAVSSMSNETRLGAQVLMQYGHGNVWVLWLGDIGAEWNYPKNRSIRRGVGLLLTRTDQGNDEERGRFAYQRLGVCTWYTEDTMYGEDMQRLSWSNVELELH